MSTPLLSLRSFSNDQYCLDKVFYSNFYKLRGVTDVNKRPVIVDIGAHCGYFAFCAAALGAKTVYAFEPFLENYKILIKNTAQDVGPELDVIQPLQLGVYPTAGVFELDYPKLNDEKYFDFMYLNLGGDNPIKSRTVFFTLDALISDIVKEPIDILKISIGYAEFDILNGAKLDTVQNVCGETRLSQTQIEPFKAMMATKDFADARITVLEDGASVGSVTVLFHFSKSSLTEWFL